MRQIIRPTDCALALCALFLGAPIASGQISARGPRTEVTNYLFCVAHEQAGQLTALYYSADFVTTGQNIRPVQDAFLAFLQQKYSYKTDPSSVQQISCTGVQSVAESQSIEKIYIDRDRQDKRYKVIETGWRYPGAVTTGAASTGGAAPPAAPSAGTQPVPGAPAAQGHGFSETDISGVYNGSYQCTNPPHETKFKVSLVVTANGVLTGVVTFDAQGSSGAHPANFSLTGHATSAAFDSHFAKWETPAPARSMIMGTSAFNVNTSFGLNGAYDPRGSFGQNNPSSDTISGFIDGVVVNPACSFSAKRDNVQSAEPSPSAAAGQAATNAPAPTAQTPQAQDPRLAQISPQDRQFALDEVPYSKRACQNNAFLSGLMDCSCFAQIVLDYRIAHAGETVRVPNALRGSVATPEPLINVIAAGNLDCNKCLTDDRLTKWAVEQMRTPETASPAPVTSFSDCVVRTFLKSFKAKPYVGTMNGLYYEMERLDNQAVVACEK